jgi:hypothetical protein
MNAGKETLYDIGHDGKPDWTRFNASVLGNLPVNNSIYTLSHLPGINYEPYVYQNVFFGATREYGPEEGWQTVHGGRRRKGQRHQAYNQPSRPTADMSFPYAVIDSQK